MTNSSHDSKLNSAVDSKLTPTINDNDVHALRKHIATLDNHVNSANNELIDNKKFLANLTERNVSGDVRQISY